MNKTFKIIISLFLVAIVIVIILKLLNINQEKTSFNLVTLSEINNQAGFLWVDKIVDESWLEINDIVAQIPENLISGNESLEISFLEYNKDNRPVDPLNITLLVPAISNQPINSNKFKLSLLDIENLPGNDLRIGIVAENKESGNYRYKINIKHPGFEEIHNVGVLEFKLEVNNQSSALYITFIILLIVALTSLLCWFLLLRKEFFPTFIDEGEIVFPQSTKNDIYFSSKSRRVVIGKPQSDNIFKIIFLGKIQCELSDLPHQICIEAVKDKETDETNYSIVCFPPTKIENGELGYMYHRNNYKFVTGNDIIEFKYNNQFHKKN